MPTQTDVLRAELERSFELEEIKSLATELLGFPAASLAGAETKGAMARQVVASAAERRVLAALADAMILTRRGLAPAVASAFQAASGDDLSVGSVVGDFRIQQKLGAGASGATYLAERTQDGAAVRAVVKVSHGQLAADPSASLRFVVFQRAIARTPVAGLAHVLDAGLLPDGRAWVATEFVEGQSLAARVLRSGPVPFAELRGIVRSAAQTLVALASAGFAHGDVKSENVFVLRTTPGGKTEGSVVLTDAGTYRLFPRSSFANGAAVVAAPNPRTSAPELLDGAVLDARSDLFALAAVMYEALCGRAAFGGDSTVDAFAARGKALEAPSRFAPAGWISADVDAWLLNQLARDPASRAASSAQFVDELDALGRASRLSLVPGGAFSAPDFEKVEKKLSKKPDNEELASELERLAETGGAWDKLTAAFEQIAAATDNIAAKKALLLRAGRIFEHELQDAAGADRCYRAVLAVDPGEDVARGALEAVKRSTGDAEGLSDLLLERVERETNGARRAELLRELAGLYEHSLKQVDSAFFALTQALSEEPSDDFTSRELERLATTPERWNEAASALQEAAGTASDASVRARILLRLGGWYSDRLHRPDLAVPALSQALAADPTLDLAVERLAEVYRKSQSWTELAAFLNKSADAVPHTARSLERRTEAADIYATRLRDSAKAEPLLRSVLAEDAGHVKASAALSGLFRQDNRFADLATHLENSARHQHGETKCDTLVAAAEICDESLGDQRRAMGHYEAVLALDPANALALKGLDRLYGKAGRHQEHLAILRKQAEVSPTPRQQIASFEQLGALLESEFVNHAEAADAFEQVIALDATHEAANVALSRLYRHLGRFADLATTLERHASATADVSRKVDLLMEASRVLLSDVGAPERALSVCERVLAIDASNSDALELLARLKTSSGDANAALDAIETLAKSERDPKKKAELFVKAGRLMQDKGDLDRAIDRYKLALDADRAHLPAFSALRATYSARGDAHGAVDLLVREIEVTTGGNAQAKLLAELGELYRDRIDDAVRAREAFARALDLDPTCTPAAMALGQAAFDAEDWALAIRHLEPLLSRTQELTPELARDVSVKAGDAFSKLREFGKAQRAYLTARASAPNDRQVQERVASVTFDSGSFDEAAELYRSVIKNFGNALVGHERGEVVYRLGESLRLSGALDEAIAPLEEAVSLLADAAEPARSLRTLYGQKSNWKKAVAVAEKRLEHARDDERYELLVALGDIYNEQLSNREAASKSYVEALEIRADDRNLLTKLMGVYSTNKDWSKLVEVILRIAELVDDPRMLTKYFNTAAQICHRELGRFEESADYYEQALEHDPSLTASFAALVDVLTHVQNWNRLVDAYKSHLRRAASTLTPQQRAQYLDAVGEILHHRLERTDEAVDAYEQALQLDPENRKRTEVLAEIYGADPSRNVLKAAAAHRVLIARNPYRVESYQALRRVFTEAKRADEAWCVCQALRCMNMAEPEEDSFFKKHRARAPSTSREFFTEEVWRTHLLHSSQDPMLTGIFAVLTPAVVGVRAQTHAQFGVKTEAKRAADKDPAAMAQMLHYAAGVAQIPLPDVYYREQDAGGLSFMFTSPPSIGLGKGALAGGPGQALAFVAGRHLTYYRNGHFLRQLIPTGTGLRAWLLAAIKSVVPQFPVPADMQASVDEHLGAIAKYVVGPQNEQLKSQVSKLLQAAPELDLKRWVAGVDLAADRVGFVLANDLEISLAIVRASPEDSSSIPQKERMAELQLYAVSEEYMALRKTLGITIA